MKKIIRLTESDLTRIVRRVIKENYISENYKIITSEEVQKIKSDLEDLFNNYIIEKMVPENGLHYSDITHYYNLWRKKNISHFTRRPSKKFGDELEYDELSKDQKDEWKELWKTNIETLGKLFEELINTYEEQYKKLEDDSSMKNGLSDVLDVLYFDYDTYFEHVMYPKKHN